MRGVDNAHAVLDGRFDVDAVGEAIAFELTDQPDARRRVQDGGIDVRRAMAHDQRIEAFGSRGLVRVDNVLESSVSVWAEAGMASDTLQNFFLDRYAEAYRRELAHFADILAGKARPSVGYTDAVAALALAEAAGASARSGQVVQVS